MINYYRHAKEKAGVFTLQAILVSHHSSAFFLVNKTLQKYSKVYQSPTQEDHRIGK
jgi:hypothetical protein